MSLSIFFLINKAFNKTLYASSTRPRALKATPKLFNISASLGSNFKACKLDFSDSVFLFFL